MRRTMGLLQTIIIVLTLTASPSIADEGGDNVRDVRSPDGRISVEIYSRDGGAYYRVSQDGESVIHESRLGFRFAEGAHLEDGLTLFESEASRADAVWEQPWGERRLVRDHHNEILARFSQEDRDAFSVRIRVFNDGVGLRYETPGEAGIERRITDELTEFRVAADATAWWIPAAGWNRYEYLYQETRLLEVERAHTPFTAKLPDGPYIAIHEAALVDYAGAWIAQARPGVLTTELAPWHDGIKVRVTGEFKTPWRTIQIADDAVGLINGADISLNLNEPNALGDVSWVEPGKYIGIWWGMHLGVNTWGSGETHGATTERTRRYLDFAADNGFAGVLVEGWNYGWDGDWFSNGDVFSFTRPYPDFDLEGLAAYARERGVRLIGHHETSGGVTNYENQIEDAFALYGGLGVAQVKTGYVADGGGIQRRDTDGILRYEWHDGQFMANHHIRALEVAARHKVSLNAHEPIKDTGLRRTYPNALSREGARGQEYNAWGDPPNPPEHTALLPFTRMLSGPMDFTPGIFDLDWERPDGIRGVQTTLAKQLALYVVIYSPIQMAADLPQNYAAHDDAFQFIRDVPTDWENSIALQGDIGDFVVIARQERDGDDWYLGALTDEAERALSVPLSFLEAGRTYRAEIYRDGEGADWESAPYEMVIEDRDVTANDILDLPLAAGGGAAIRFVAR